MVEGQMNGMADDGLMAASGGLIATCDGGWMALSAGVLMEACDGRLMARCDVGPLVNRWLRLGGPGYV